MLGAVSLDSFYAWLHRSVSCSRRPSIVQFPDDFPNNPPKMKFLTKMYHPNIYPDGTVCISILHAPGVDAMNTLESADERWRPILGVEQVRPAASEQWGAVMAL